MEDRAKFDFSKLKVEKLRKDHDLSTFDCGDSDLNEFVQKDAYRQQEVLMGTTHICFYDNEIIGYFTLLTDVIKASETIDSGAELLSKDITYKEYPAMKIGRFAISKQFQKRSFGATILKIIVGKISANLQEIVGCRFITVDAYQNSVAFYKKCGFIEMPAQRKSSTNIALYLDIYKALKAAGLSNN